MWSLISKEIRLVSPVPHTPLHLPASVSFLLDDKVAKLLQLLDRICNSNLALS